MPTDPNLTRLVGLEINLFDSNGGVLDINGDYVTNWWDKVNTFILIKEIGKYFFLSSLDGKVIVKHKTSRIHSISNRDIEFKIS